MNHEDELSAADLPFLEGWPALSPDPEAMAQVTELMVAGVTAARTEAAEPGESQFRILTLVWGGVVLAGYLAWDFFSSWLSAHPVWLVLLLVVGGLSLVAPLLLLPILLGADSFERPAAD